jgi:hypothetical protein
MSGTRTAIDRPRLERLIERERALFRERTPRSRALAAEAREVQIFGVPMPWMAKWVGGYPLFYAEARGARITDVDGHEYIECARRRWRRTSTATARSSTRRSPSSSAVERRFRRIPRRVSVRGSRSARAQPIEQRCDTPSAARLPSSSA